MSNCISHPVRSDHIDRIELSEVEGPIVVTGREIGLGPVVEVSDVVNRHQIAVDCGVRQPGIFRRPISVLLGGNRRPPGNEQQENGEENQQWTSWFGRKKIPDQHRRAKNGEGNGQNSSGIFAGQVGIIDSKRAPARHYHNGNASQQDDESTCYRFHKCLLTERKPKDNKIFSPATIGVGGREVLLTSAFISTKKIAYQPLFFTPRGIIWLGRNLRQLASRMRTWALAGSVTKTDCK